MRAELLQLAAELSRRREPFVLAVVVRREPASSAQPGDMAVITGDGVYHGWIGGACAAPAVRREAERVLADGEPRLLSLGPDPTRQAHPGITALPIQCHSGGTVEIFLEPVVPAPCLRVFGSSPAARALVAVGKAMGYATELVAPGLSEAGAIPGVDLAIEDVSGEAAAAPRREPLFAVVATMGEFDEEAIASALAATPDYLGVVASRRRFAEVRAGLLAQGVPAEEIDRIRNPAGLDVGARRPEELAVSIFAEIVQLRRQSDRMANQATAAKGTGEVLGKEPREPTAAKAAEREGADRPAARGVTLLRTERAVDPVCGMSVDLRSRHAAELDGIRYVFCCAGCRERFLAAPASFLAASGDGGR